MSAGRTGVACGLGLAIAAVVSAPAAAQLDPRGFWRTEDRAAIVEIAACPEGGEALCGVVVALNMQDPEVVAHADELCGLTLLRDLALDPAAGRWRGGRLFDPETDATYDAAIEAVDRGGLFANGDVLRVTVHEGVEALGIVVRWRRTTPPPRRCTR